MNERRETISIRARFERFPATVKGAFVIRGEDRDPHQVVLREARVVSVAGRGERPLTMPPTTLDVAPKQDVFVPFELSVVDLEPGWYGLECDVEVDGIQVTFPGGRRFSVAWPRATTRRGNVAVGREVALGGGRAVRVNHVECGGDAIKVHLEVTPPGSVALRLSADGEPLEVLEADFDDAGKGKVTAYPLMRTHGRLRIEFGGKPKGRKGEAAVEVALP